MARAPKAAPATGTAVVTWEEQLAQDAKAAAAQESSAGGMQFISVQGGKLSFGGNELKDNQITCIIVSSRLENVYYEGVYDRNNPTPPLCYAFGTDDKGMAPHPNVFEAGNEQNETCTGCPKNEWGSAETGRGKACHNARRLIILPAGSFDEHDRFVMPEEDDLKASEEASLRLSVTNVKTFANFVKGLAGGAMGRSLPPYAVFCRIKVTTDGTPQYKMNFTVLAEVPGDYRATVTARRKAAEAIVETPYPDAREAPPPPRAARASKAAPKAPVRGRAGR